MSLWRSRSLALAAAMWLGSIGGCALWRTPPRPVGVKPLAPDEQRQVIGEYESRRNDALRQAALEAWQRGDTAACEKSLRDLLVRNERDAETRRLLADLYLEQGDRAASERELRTLLSHHPDDTAARQALRMLHQHAGAEDGASAVGLLGGD
jgi:Tfp pilus assembly protein PilF